MLVIVATDNVCAVTFKVFDTDGNGYISKSELIDMYTATYHVRLPCSLFWFMLLLLFTHSIYVSILCVAIIFCMP